MRGRKPKPRQAQIAEGDPRKVGKKKLQQKLDAQPSAAAGLPSCPEHLTGHAKVAWDYLSPELEAMKLAKRPDGPAFEAACRAIQRAMQAEEDLDNEGLYVRDIRGERKVNPAFTIAEKAWTRAHRFLSDFGLSGEVSRMRLTIDKKEDDAGDLMKMLTSPRVPREMSGKPLIQ